ncbi:hypothetical protein VTO42DRAFT_235 [Malbranchea cinnamomea]
MTRINDEVDGKALSESMSPIEEEEDRFFSIGDEEPLDIVNSASTVLAPPSTEPTPPSCNSEWERKLKTWIEGIKKSRKYGFRGQICSMKALTGMEESDECLNKLVRRGSTKTASCSVASTSDLRTVRTASISGTSLRTVNRLRSNTRSSNQPSTCHSSGLIGSNAKVVLEETKLTSTLSLDQSIWDRAVHRRQIIKEMIETEIAYVASLKSLVDTLSVMVVTRSGILRSAEDLLLLHNDFLSALCTIDSRPSPSSNPYITRSPSTKRPHDGTHSPEPRVGSPDRRAMAAKVLNEPIEKRIKGSRTKAAEANEAAEVAEALVKLLPRFAVYAEYSLKYHVAAKEIEDLRKNKTNIDAFELGIEASIKQVFDGSTRQMFAKQGLTLSDLLMKPIQRVCKYQLFLADLLKKTPASDCLVSHEIIHGALQRVIQEVQAINRASDDPIAKDRLQKSMSLQEKLEFCRERIGERDILQDFGLVKACGVLHVSYQTPTEVTGQYMMCALFNTHLLLATFQEENGKFKVVAMIRTAEIELKAADERTGSAQLSLPQVTNGH